MSPRRNWDSPTPSPASECPRPPGTRGKGHTRLRAAGEGVGGSQLRRLEKKLSTLPTLQCLIVLFIMNNMKLIAIPLPC